MQDFETPALHNFFFRIKLTWLFLTQCRAKIRKPLKRKTGFQDKSFFFIIDSSNISEVNEVNKDNIKAETIFFIHFFFIISFILLCILIIIVAKVIWPYWNSLIVYHLWTLCMDIFINEITYLSRIKDGKNVVESFV